MKPKWIIITIIPREASSQPSGWNYNWNLSGVPVVWGCSE